MGGRREKADDILIAKDSRETLKQGIERLDFEAIFPSDVHTTREKAHGRFETRTITVSTALYDYVLFPSVATGPIVSRAR